MRRFLLVALLMTACTRTATPTAPASTVLAHVSAPLGVPATPVTLDPRANEAEARFVSVARRALSARYPTPASAESAGYKRYTAEDQDGIITYTNLKWFADDPGHPTQLWYDAHGRFLGADYTMRVTDRSRRPNVWGLQPGRWVHFIAHMHYVVRKDSKTDYRSMLNDDYRANGGDPAHPSAQPIVRARYAKHPSDVKLIFQLPEIWIASVWLIPNPNGAFADSDPFVKPTAGAQPDIHPRNQ